MEKKWRKRIRGVVHLGDSWAAGVGSEGSDQRDGQEGEEQSPEDVHQVVHYVGERTL